MPEPKTVFISADHGLAIVYFLQTGVLPALRERGARVVLLTDDGIREQIARRFEPDGLTVEGLRFQACRTYFESRSHSLQHWMHFLRWMGGSDRINTNAMDGHLRQMGYEASPNGKRIMPLIRLLTRILRKSRPARRLLAAAQNRYNPNLYADLFAKYNPALVVASTPGWRWDRYLLREAAARGVNTAAVIVGWDNPSSYRLPGAPVNWISCWSEIQKRELVLGSDWDPARVNIGGIPSYDGYFQRSWLMPKEEYYALHGLDPQRKLLSYACSFATFSPNYANIAALADLVNREALAEPCQLIIRLHPNYFQPGSLYEGEARRVRELVKDMPHVHIVEPVPLGGELGYYSGEDMPEKASMMAYSDVFLTVYSTMVVETAVHDRPIVSVCIDVPGGWNTPGKFSLALSEIGEWPTHQRFRAAKAGRVVSDAAQLKAAVDRYLRDPNADRAERHQFIQDECTFSDASAGRRTGEFLRGLL
jgi:hypothetical protein